MADDGRSRLGRGLAALMGDVGTETATSERVRGQRRVPIEFLKPNPHNPRRNFSDAELDDLAASIKERGIIQPVVVRSVRGAKDAYEIAVDAGRKSPLRPAALASGTRVEVRDLFYATPARLKFMKSERVEAASIADTVKRLALARPDIAFSLSTDERTALRLEACQPGLIDHGLARLGRILGSDFMQDALPV